MAQSQMTQAQINTTIFHQVNGKNGEIRFRSKFGRQKVMVFRRHDETKYFYVDIYGNKHSRYMCIAMDVNENLHIYHDLNFNIYLI